MKTLGQLLDGTVFFRRRALEGAMEKIWEHAQLPHTQCSWRHLTQGMTLTQREAAADAVAAQFARRDYDHDGHTDKNLRWWRW